ncbi:MAG TPA: LamG domain-containing protein, partial [Bacteroidetes bacterium]|nr:LamG domain-containing protein [Bacteroidota bacterium]
NGDYCAHCNYTEGLIVDYFAKKLWYKWPGNVYWAGNSGITIPLDEWSYVAMVVTPDSVTLYLNDQKYVSHTTQDTADINNIYIGYGHYGNSFRGNIDEVTMWKKALTEADIRRLRHLTKEDEIGADPDLIGYWQFNELVDGKMVMDKAGLRHGSLHGGGVLSASTVPAGGGASQTIDLSAGQTAYDFANVGAKIYMSDCEEPNGQMVISRLNVAPDAQPNMNDFPENYWIINQYPEASSGQVLGGGFPPLDSIELTPTDMGFVNMLSNAEAGILHLRSENGDSLTWETKAKGVDLTSGTLRFDRKSTVMGSTQITLSNGAPVFDEIDPGRICEADTIPGRALEMTGTSGEYVEVPALNLNTNTFTTTAWVKSDGIQNSWAGIVFCRGGSTTAGLSAATNNELRYHWNGGEWGWSSGAFLPQDEWAHVALVVEPTTVTIYLNGVPYTRTRNHAIEEFDVPTRIGRDATSSSRTFDGQIDEVCIWDRALSQNEIRELMHLTKQDILATDPNLKVYLQFNETGGKSYDKTGNKNHGVFHGNGTVRTTSTAPVGGGVSGRMDVTAGGVFAFGNTGVKLGFNPAAATYPNGELCVSRLNVPPETLPAAGSIASDGVYWIVDNFGTNSNFTALDSFVVDDVPSIYAVHENTPALFSIFKRNSTAFGNTWGSSFDAADLVVANGNGRGKITFSTGSGITGFSQFAIGDTRGVKLSLKVFLEGPFAGGLLSDGLRSGGLLPTGEPYTNLGFAQKGGGGGERCSAVVFAAPAANNDAVVDWVQVELRDKNAPATVLFTRSALLQRDGDVVDVDGVSPVNFALAAADDYYVAVRHRNHLGVRTPTALSLSSTPAVHDFTTSLSQAWADPSNSINDAMKDLGGGVFGLWRGTTNGDNLLNVFDLLQTKIEITPNRADVYTKGDLNMDGLVNVFDLLQSKISITPNKSAHLE